ncbi:MAG: ABC transporter substrate-binding protein [Eubacteriales bacterium]|nr:ABC transporter substrate-binding protein [Eubacteriales bacterium]
MKRRIMSCLMTAAMVAGVLATSVSAEDYALTDVTFDNVQLKLYASLSNASQKYYEEKLQEFNDMDNGITVELTNINTEADYLDKLSTDFASGDTPNVFMEYGGARCLDYIEADALLNLQPYLEADEEWYGNFMESCWEPAHFEDYGYEGLYCVPYTNYQVVLFYNKDILAENNLEVPTTWDELLSACETLKANGVQPFIVGEKDNYRFGHLHTILSLKTYGEEIGKQLGSREVTYDGAEMQTIYSMIQELVDKGYLGDNLLSTDATQEASYFAEGKAAFQYNGSWGASSIQNSGSELYTNQTIGVARFPAVTEEYAKVDMGGGNDSYFVSQLGKSEEEIAASVVLLKYITSADFCAGLMEVNPNTMAIKTGVESENYLLNEISAIMADTEVTRSDLQNYDSQAHMINTVRTALQGIAMGNTPEEVGAEIVDTMAQYE